MGKSKMPPDDRRDIEKADRVIANADAQRDFNNYKVVKNRLKTAKAPALVWALNTIASRLERQYGEALNATNKLTAGD